MSVSNDNTGVHSISFISEKNKVNAHAYHKMYNLKFL